MEGKSEIQELTEKDNKRVRLLREREEEGPKFKVKRCFASGFACKLDALKA